MSTTRTCAGSIMPLGLALAATILLSACGPPERVTPTGSGGSAMDRDALEDSVDSLVIGSDEGRAAASAMLSRTRRPRIAALLLERLRRSDPEYRLGAGRAFTSLDSLPDVDALIPALKDTAAYVRWSVAPTLGVHGTDKARLALRSAISDSDFTVRRAAARSLGQLADTGAAPMLTRALADPAEEVRAAAATSLGVLGQAAVPALQALVENDSGMVVPAAIEAIGRAGRSSSVALIGVALLDGAVPTRMAASRSLGIIGSREAAALLSAAAVDDPEPLVREAAFRALALGHQQTAVDMIRRRTDAEVHVFVRLAWIDGLDAIAGQRASPHSETATEMLEAFAENDPSPDVRAAATVASGR